MMLIFLAGLQGVPTELYDAAKVDGAGPWATLPARHAADDLAGALLQPDHRPDLRRSSTSPRRTSSATAAATRRARPSSSTSTSTARGSPSSTWAMRPRSPGSCSSIVLGLTIAALPDRRDPGSTRAVSGERRRPAEFAAVRVDAELAAAPADAALPGGVGRDAPGGHDRLGVPDAARCSWSRPRSRTRACSATPGAPLYPAVPETFAWQGAEYPVYDVPTPDGAVHAWALVEPHREDALFIDPANPEAGPIAWDGRWRTLDAALEVRAAASTTS